jgi:hypothetical protein
MLYKQQMKLTVPMKIESGRKRQVSQKTTSVAAL